MCVCRCVRPNTRACEHGVGEGWRKYDYRFVILFFCKDVRCFHGIAECVCVSMERACMYVCAHRSMCAGASVYIHT